MPQRFSIFPLPSSGTTCIVTTDTNGAIFPIGCTVTYFDAAGNEISGESWQVTNGGPTGHAIHIPENAASLTVTSSQSQTLAKNW